jgi:CheY-like chemotaxis protein
MRILIADDVEDTRQLMKLFLEMNGHAVLEASNGKEAVECAIQERPDLILMDVSMPIMDGFDATRRIRAHAGVAHIPIVAISAFLADPAWREEAFRCGCNHCYAKPLDMEALGELVAMASGRPPCQA